MPSFDVSAARAFGFEDDPGPFGHITSLEIAGFQLDKDIVFENPTPSGGNVTVVGPLSFFSWGSGLFRPGVADPIGFSVQVSSENAMGVKSLMHQEVRTTRVTFSFVVYNYDYEAKTYFAACQQADEKPPLDGRLRDQGRGNVTLMVAQEAEPTVPNGPMLFDLAAEILPGLKEQKIVLAESPTKRIIRPWGMAIPGQSEVPEEEMATTSA